MFEYFFKEWMFSANLKRKCNLISKCFSAFFLCSLSKFRIQKYREHLAAKCCRLNQFLANIGKFANGLNISV